MMPDAVQQVPTGEGTQAPRRVHPAEVWQAVERDYRAGRFSIRELGRLHGVSEASIRRRARREGWQHDLAEQVDETARTALMVEPAAVPFLAPLPAPVPALAPAMHPAGESDPVDEHIIEQAAATVVQVVRSHRIRIRQGLDLIELLTKQLIDVAGRRDEFEADIEQECFEDKGVERRNRLMKAVALGTHASIASSLAGALKTWISLERQAFNIPEDVSAEAPAAKAVEAQTPEEAYLRMIGR